MKENCLSENKFLVKRMGLAESFGLVIKPLTDNFFRHKVIYKYFI